MKINAIKYVALTPMKYSNKARPPKPHFMQSHSWDWYYDWPWIDQAKIRMNSAWQERLDQANLLLHINTTGSHRSNGSKPTGGSTKTGHEELAEHILPASTFSTAFFSDSTHVHQVLTSKIDSYARSPCIQAGNCFSSEKPIIVPSSNPPENCRLQKHQETVSWLQ